MLTARMFMASSGRAKPLAAELRNLLESQVWFPNIRVNVTAWWDALFKPGEDTLTGLIRAVRDCDFAIVLLTNDGVHDADNDIEQKVRENMMFEFGLSMGTLGLDPRRCFVLASDQKSLPSDLQGLTYVRIEEGGGLRLDESRLSLRNVVKRIMQSVEHLGAFERPMLPLLSCSRLLLDERPKFQGGSLEEPFTIVVSSDHLGTDTEFAERIMSNLRVGCEYRYFLHHRGELSHVVNFLYSLVAAGLEGHSRLDRNETMLRNQQAVRNSLETLKKYLRIYFIAGRCFYCRIHNASHEPSAVCYLEFRTEDLRFAKWSTRGEAFEAARQLLALREEPSEPRESGIFRSTTEFDVFSRATRSLAENLREEMRRLFPEALWKDVEFACFSGVVERVSRR